MQSPNIMSPKTKMSTPQESKGGSQAAQGRAWLGRSSLIIASETGAGSM